MLEYEDMIPSEVQYKTYRLAGFWVRLWAFLIDLMIISILNVWLMHPLIKWIDLPNVLSYWLQMGLVSLGFLGYLYFVIMTRIWSQTLGKMIMGIKVIRLDGQPLDILTVLFREVVGRIISQAFGLHLGYLWMVYSKRKQTWHDRLGDTLVVFEEDLTQKQFVQIPTTE